MKKKICILMAGILMLFSLSSCSSSEGTSAKTNISIAALKGPTGMGMAKLMNDNEAGSAANTYDFTISGTADEITVGLVQGTIDIAAVPANLASVLYNRTEGEIQIAAINTLGVLYLLEKGETINSLSDLQGQTIYTTGKGATPEYTLNDILERNGLQIGSDVTVEFKSEPTEIAALFIAGTIDLAVLPEPYVSSVLHNNPDIRVAMSLNEQWEALNETGMVTGVIAVRSAFIKENPEDFSNFLAEYRDSVAFINENVKEAAALVEKFDIANAEIAEIAIPNCNIVMIEGAQMEEAVTVYLNILYNANPESIGGNVPNEDFFYQE